jgi:small subunit ribosomal protein S20
MPNITSAMKRVKTSAAAEQRNKALKSRIRTAKNKFYAALEANDKELALETFNKYCSTLDKAAKKKIIKKNNVNRRKSRASKKLAAL